MKCVQITSSSEPKEWTTKVKVIASGKQISKECLAVFDTGAHNTSISKSVFESIKAEVKEEVMNCTPTGREKTYTSMIDIELCEGCVIRNVEAILSSHNMGCDILIGMNVITKGDFHSFRDSDGLYTCTFRVYES